MIRTKTILFVLLIIALWIPFIQRLSGIFQEPQLKGTFHKPIMPELTTKTVYDLSFQQQVEKYENFNLGFRAFFIKIKNSFDYILFGKFNAQDVIEGKEGYLFSNGSVERTIGKLYSVQDHMDSVMYKINFMKQGLLEKGGKLMVIIAPSKESIYPEFLPQQYSNVKYKDNDYNEYQMQLTKNNIPFIDYCAWFKSLKDTSQYPLFNPAGLHWSVYGSALAHDSLIHFMENILNKRFPESEWKNIELSDTARDSDADLEDMLNLPFPLKNWRYVYPRLEMVPSTLNRFRPKVIVIGDSFFWQIKDRKKLMHIFSDESCFWYYFATAFPLRDVAGTDLENFDIMKEIISADIVLLSASIGTLSNFPYGVTDYFYNKMTSSPIKQRIRNKLMNEANNLKDLQNISLQNSISDTTSFASLSDSILAHKKDFNLIAGNGKYVCSDPGFSNLLLATQDRPSLWEKFSLISFPDGRVAIFSYADKFISVDFNETSEGIANKIEIGESEMFLPVWIEDDIVAFKSANGKFLSLNEKSYQIAGVADSIGRLEKFRFLPIKNGEFIR